LRRHARTSKHGIVCRVHPDLRMHAYVQLLDARTADKGIGESKSGEGGRVAREDGERKRITQSAHSPSRQCL